MRRFIASWFIVIFLVSCSGVGAQTSDELDPELGIRAVSELVPENSILPREKGFSVGEKVVAVLRLVSKGDQPITVGYIYPDKFAIGVVKRVKGKYAYVDWGDDIPRRIDTVNLAHYNAKQK